MIDSVAPEGITMVVELTLPRNVHVPPMQIHSEDGRVELEHPEGDGGADGMGTRLGGDDAGSDDGGSDGDGTENKQVEGYRSWQ